MNVIQTSLSSLSSKPFTKSVLNLLIGKWTHKSQSISNQFNYIRNIPLPISATNLNTRKSWDRPRPFSLTIHTRNKKLVKPRPRSLLITIDKTTPIIMNHLDSHLPPPRHTIKTIFTPCLLSQSTRSHPSDSFQSTSRSNTLRTIDYLKLAF